MDKRITSQEQLDLPGFRFHPTEDELLDFYLKRKVLGKNDNLDIIGTLNLYRYDPWELPGLAKIGEREWFFFVQRDRKHPNGGRPNRTTERGFWKATGSDKPVRSTSDPRRIIGLRKTLVFYKGRSPRGSRTDWVMNEYRMPDDFPLPKDIVLCKIYRKATSLKVLEQRAAMEEDVRMRSFQGTPETTASSSEPEPENPHQTSPSILKREPPEHENDASSKDFWLTEENQELDYDIVAVGEGNHEQLGLGFGKLSLPELQLPKFSLDWLQEPSLTQLRSPWDFHWSPYLATNAVDF